MNIIPKNKLDPNVAAEKQIAKELSELEKAYQAGISTVRDLIAPSAVQISPSYVIISGKYARTFFVIAYPRILSVNWHDPLMSVETPLDFAMHIYPEDSGKILKKLKSKAAQVESAIAINEEKGLVRDPMLETAMQDIEDLRDRLQQGMEKYFQTGFYLTIYADSLEELERYSKDIDALLAAKLVVGKRAVLEMDKAINSTLPLANDQLSQHTNLNTEPLSTMFPFISLELTSSDGILYGINRHNNSLILFDRFSLPNANAVVFATSGAGKSYAVKLEILRSMMLGTDVIVIDPENEYKHLAESVGGAFLNVSLNSESRINPFDLPKALEGEDPRNILRSAVVNLLGLMALMLGKLSTEEQAIMDKALWETYAKKDITMDTPDFANIIPPTMSDLVEVLSSMVGGDSLATRLSRFTEGTFAGIFNQPTNLNMDTQVVVFSIRDMQEQLRPIAIYIILNYIWNVVRSDLKKRLLVIDEGWWMMQHEDSAQFLFSMVKRARKYYLGVVTVTQDVSDFLASPYGKPIVTNSAMQLLLKQSPAAIDLIVDTFDLTEGEKYLLLESDVGEGIFFAGSKHVAIKIIASYIEDQIITTDPKQLLDIEHARSELQQGQ